MTLVISLSCPRRLLMFSAVGLNRLFHWTVIHTWLHHPMGNTGRLCRDVLFKKTRGVVNRCPDSSKQSVSLLTPCTALESATALLPYTLLGISHTPVQEAALAAGARISGLEIDHHSLSQGWLSSGKKGISSLPWEETWEKREETPFFPEEMEETGNKGVLFFIASLSATII